MFVTGCHRSGTSLLASLTYGLVTRQDPRQRRGDLQLKLENPLGFFESECLVDINEELLQSLGCHWDKPPLFPAIWDQPDTHEWLVKIATLRHHHQVTGHRIRVRDTRTGAVDRGDPRLSCMVYRKNTGFIFGVELIFYALTAIGQGLRCVRQVCARTECPPCAG